MKLTIPSSDLIISLSEAIDLISPIVANHHKQVAYIAFCLGRELGLSADEQRELAFAGALHDVGGLTLKDRLDALQFEYNNFNLHPEKGYLLLDTFKPFKNIALTVRYHHTNWDNGNCSGVCNEEIPLGGHILNLADRIAVLIDPNNFMLNQVDTICKRITLFSGNIFKPELVDAFLTLSKKECFWLDIKTVELSTFLMNNLDLDHSVLEEEDFLDLIKLFSHIIDFRSHFTATHSSGVAATAEMLSKIAGFTEMESQTMRIAGYIHDLGKLVIPAEILEKPGKLTNDEYAVIRSHTYYTNHVLSKVREFDTIRSWGALHHERLDGSGYPFHLKGDAIPLGARIMAVADIFTALTEDRPYRKGMQRDAVLEVIQNMANANALDSLVVSILRNNYDDINLVRKRALYASLKEYNHFTNAFLQATKR